MRLICLECAPTVNTRKPISQRGISGHMFQPVLWWTGRGPHSPGSGTPLNLGSKPITNDKRFDTLTESFPKLVEDYKKAVQTSDTINQSGRSPEQSLSFNGDKNGSDLS